MQVELCLLDPEGVVMRKWGAIFAVVGLLMFAGAAVLRIIIVPSSMVLPADTNETITYAGTMTALNPSALESGDLANAVIKDLPVDVERTVKVLEADGNKALVSDSAVIKAAETGDEVQISTYVYSLDRKSMGTIANFTDQAAENAQGDVVVGFPIGTEKQNYVGWVQEIADTTLLKYEGEEQVDGLTAYRFVGSGVAPLADPEGMGLPTSVPKEQLATMAAAGGLPADTLQQLSQALPLLPAEIPLSYTFDSTGRYWVDPTTGLIVDMKRTMDISVAMTGFEDLQMSASSISIEYTPQNVTDMVNDAEDMKAQLALFGTTLPVALSILGGLSLAASIMILRPHRGETGEEKAATRRPRPVLSH